MNFPTTKTAWVQNLSAALVGAWLFFSAAFAYAQMPHYFWSEYRQISDSLPWALHGLLAIAPIEGFVPWCAVTFFWVLFRSLPRKGCGWSWVLLAVSGFCLSAVIFGLAAEMFGKSLAMVPLPPDGVRIGANVVFIIGLVVFSVWQEWRFKNVSAG